MGPPNVLDAPKPTSSSNTRTTFGAFLGASTGRGKSDLESLALRPICPLKGAGGVGSTSCADSGALQPARATENAVRNISRDFMSAPLVTLGPARLARRENPGSNGVGFRNFLPAPGEGRCG